uniref:Uncharacterized protein n=1 Tax=Rhizophora mucronata TaxID=61149 RepID=A0A2P2IPJ8_RHIMU
MKQQNIAKNLSIVMHRC